MSEIEWKRANRANWDERVGVHMAPGGYDIASLRAGNARLDAIEEAELGSVAGKRVLHLQCHFGRDSLILAQRGAEVTGLDFSTPAIAAALALTEELGLADRARFFEADLYDARTVIPEPASFDLVYVTWGALLWLADIRLWAEIVAYFLKPGGRLYLAEGHPIALVFDDLQKSPDGVPGFFAPYFSPTPIEYDDSKDYANPTAVLKNTKTFTWIHPIGDVVTGLTDAGLRLDWLHEHDAVTWRMFNLLQEDEAGLFRWPEQKWLPLAFSLSATRA
jgi:SAM-dependent methyltransferase